MSNQDIKDHIFFGTYFIPHKLKDKFKMYFSENSDIQFKMGLKRNVN